MSLISIDDRVNHLKSCGCTILEHTTEVTAAESARNGSDPLDEPVPGGWYRIVQVDTNNNPTDASYGGPINGVTKTDFPVIMSATSNIEEQIWKLTPQYGVKNGHTIVPMFNPGPDNTGLGATALNNDNAVTVKQSGCYPVWHVKGSEKVTYEENGGYVTIFLYRIREPGSDRCWKTDSKSAVKIDKATPANQRPPASELYQFIPATLSQTVNVTSVENVTVRASNAEVVKRSYFGSQIQPKQLDRIVSLQLETDAHDQGWASQPDRGLWSWFEIAVFTKMPPKNSLVNPNDIKKGKDGKPLTFISHRVKLQSSYAEQTGILFGKDHEIWKGVSPGDSIVVLACAQYAAWCLNARRGNLTFQELISPDAA